MNPKSLRNKYSLAELALLGVFALGLAVSYVLVTVRNRIILSEPIMLDFAGLSVAMPKGSGWKGDLYWNYGHDNDYTVTTTFSPGRRTSAVVQCRLLLAPEDESPEDCLTRQINSAGGKILSSGVIDNEPPIFWVQTTIPVSHDDVFLGRAGLEPGRVFEIKSVAVNDSAFAAKVFSCVANSLSYNNTGLLEKGAEFLDDLRQAGIDNIFDPAHTGSAEKNFLVTENGSPAGFSVDTFQRSGAENDWPLFQLNSYFYIKKDFVRTSTGLFKSTGDFNRFIWQSRQNQITTPPRSMIYQTELAEGVIESSNFFSPADKKYPARPWILPQILLDIAAERFAGFGADSVLLDVLLPDGSFVPARLSVQDADALTDDTEPNAVSAVRVEYLHKAGVYEIFYLDAAGKTIRKDSRQDTLYIWKPTGRDDIRRLIGNPQDYTETMEEQ